MQPPGTTQNFSVSVSNLHFHLKYRSQKNEVLKYCIYLTNLPVHKWVYVKNRYVNKFVRGIHNQFSKRLNDKESLDSGLILAQEDTSALSLEKEILNECCHRLSHRNNNNKSNNKRINKVGLQSFIFCYLNIKSNYQNV